MWRHKHEIIETTSAFQVDLQHEDQFQPDCRLHARYKAMLHFVENAFCCFVSIPTPYLLLLNRFSYFTYINSQCLKPHTICQLTSKMTPGQVLSDTSCLVVTENRSSCEMEFLLTDYSSDKEVTNDKTKVHRSLPCENTIAVCLSIG